MYRGEDKTIWIMKENDTTLIYPQNKAKTQEEVNFRDFFVNSKYLWNDVNNI